MRLRPQINLHLMDFYEACKNILPLEAVAVAMTVTNDVRMEMKDTKRCI